MSAPPRLRPAPVAPAATTGYEVRQRLAGPLKWVFFGVAIMAADFAHVHFTGDLFAVGPVRPIYVAGPMVLIGLLFAFGRLVR